MISIFNAKVKRTHRSILFYSNLVTLLPKKENIMEIQGYNMPDDLYEAKIEGSLVNNIPALATDFYDAGHFEWLGVEIDDWVRLFKI
jgi:hypothetical protein